MSPLKPAKPRGNRRQTRRRHRFALSPFGGGAQAAEQGVPDPLVVPAGRDRAVLVHRPADHRRLPDAVLRLVDGRGHLQRRVSAAARRRDVQGLRLHPRHQLRGARRPVRPAGPPLGGADVLRVDHGPPGAHLLHRGVPPSPRNKLGHRLAAADPVDVRGLLRLLAARRPAVRHRSARGPFLDLLGHAGDRHLAALGAVRWRFPVRRAGISCSADGILLPRMYALHILLLPGNHLGAHRCSPGDAVVPEAHPLPGPR